MGHRSSVAHGCLMWSCHRLLKPTFITSVKIIPINLSEVKVPGIFPDGSDVISLCHITYLESIFFMDSRFKATDAIPILHYGTTFVGGYSTLYPEFFN